MSQFRSLDPFPAEHIRNSLVFRDGLPSYEFFPEAIITPLVKRGAWGVFDAQGKPIESTIDYWFKKHMPFQKAELSCSLEEVEDNAQSGFIYGGKIYPDPERSYGHVILESLCHLWPIVRHGLNGRRIVFQSEFSDTAQWYNIPYIFEIMNALGITEKDIYECRKPERLRDIWIPGPCVQLNYAVTLEAAKPLYRKIGEFLIESDASKIDRPVYLSRSKVAKPSNGIIGESELEAALHTLGFDIVHPQELSFREQVSIFRRYKSVCGFIGSAFHTSVFAQNSSRMIAINHLEGDFFHNYFLTDAIGENKTEIYKVSADILRASEKKVLDSIFSDYLIFDPKALSEELANLVFL
ncbi:hypothetical protein C5L14_04855 [Labrys okinawensis]|uniref:Glycosyltransferase 61 catalytic domain-containing protein n=1 Tax=Labrys okinawensis TaxID=346911 RepID=A0A2S9QGU3_9HYPH|nr:glycosyltransferase 61 family protein [Labrys okinawensis]PRH88569.1 hypothetical protein C5L14_04855 [Labrys okinawensis]